MPDSEPKTEDQSRWQAIIGNYPTSREAHEAGLAVLAAGKPYWVYPIEKNFFSLHVQKSLTLTLNTQVEAILNTYT